MLECGAEVLWQSKQLCLPRKSKKPDRYKDSMFRASPEFAHIYPSKIPGSYQLTVLILIFDLIRPIKLGNSV